MANESRHIAQQLSEVQSTHLAPIYDQVRERLLGLETDSSLRLGTLREETAERRNNYSFLQKVHDLLPIAVQPEDHYKKKYFSVSDQYTALAIQANALWLFAPDNEINMTVPFTEMGLDKVTLACNTPYLKIGQRFSDKNNKISELLLMSAMPELMLRTVEVPRPTATLLNYYADQAISSPYTPDEINKLYDTSSDTLIIKPDSERSVRDAYSNRFSFRGSPKKVDGLTEARMRWKGEMKPDAKLAVGVTNYELAQFGTWEHLGKLALVFGVEDEYQKLFSTLES